MTETFGIGQLRPEDPTSEYNVIQFIIQQTLLRTRTIVPVKVTSVVNAGGVVPVGFVSVQPLVNLVDGNGNSTPHGTISNVPYMRLQGGTNAIILDPVVGDNGFMAIADRDISAVKSSLQLANPGSGRTFNLADGIYLGGILNGTPKQYLGFTATGITLVDINGNSLTSGTSGWTFVGNVNWTGSFTATGNITAGQGTADQVDLQNHKHAGVTAGGAQTSVPVPGT